MTTPPGGAHRAGSPGGQAAAGAAPAAADSVPATIHDLEEAVHAVEAAEHEGRPPAAGPVANVVIAAAVVLLGIAALIGSGRLGLGSARVPDSGTWPLLVSILVVVLGIGLIAVARKTSDAERFTRTSWLVLAGLATMVVFVLVIEVIGFEIPAALLSFVWLRFLGGEGWRTSIVVSLGVVAAFYVIFVAALSVPIPHLF
ncbi:tripartite tricarboxylate transporter TctB family protein [Modestobacter marinus]|uniref:tripartite tricarboxylate transporter TctB family protein n=1 Tax=Modestobacter marinus TaxID=477641 RepID=UPI001C94EDF0|nr:tripartite tricarboxylate transporter TctB family protein [Modestobacter marinus]